MKRIEPATLAELAALTAAMPDRLQLAVLLGAWCAMRYGEIAELRRADLDLAHGKVRIRRGVTWVDGHPVVGPRRRPPASGTCRSHRASCPSSRTT